MIYWTYFKYIFKHKWYFFLESCAIGKPFQGIFHDLSKFLISEFIPYAQWLYGKYGKEFTAVFIDEAHKHDKLKTAFDIAVKYHHRRNRHHWQHWSMKCGYSHNIPHKHIIQMITDWRAMGREFNDTARDYYLKNKDIMRLHNRTKEIIEMELNIEGEC